MASIVISGDTSGTVTLQAPATSGSTVLTLPSTSGTVIVGTAGVTSVASGGTGLTSAGASGNVLTSNGTTWTSAAAPAGQIQTELFTAPGTWTKPASCTQVRVTVVGGGGGGVTGSATSVGGAGGVAIAMVPVSAPVTITVGAGGNPGVSGGTSSFGPAVSATGGGTGVAPATGGDNGTGTVSVGTALKTNNAFMNQGAFAFGIITGDNVRPSATFPASPGTPYTISSDYIAGARGDARPTASNGGIGGAIVVEYVG